MTPQTDPRWRVVGGQGAAVDFDDLFSDNYAFVRRVLAGMGAPPAALDDLAQEVFVVVHRRLAEFDSDRDVRSWLWGIARRVFHTHGRTTARADRKLRALPDPTPVPTPDEQLERRERAQIVEEILARLPAAQREVFVLMEIEGLSAPQVAQAVELPLNTVYSRLRGARKKFAKLLARRRARRDGGRHE